MNGNSQEMRLSKLEVAAGLPPPDGRKGTGKLTAEQKRQAKEEEEDRRVLEAGERLGTTMAKEHADIVAAEWDDAGSPVEAGLETKGTPASRLALEAWRRLQYEVVAHSFPRHVPQRLLARPPGLAHGFPRHTPLRPLALPPEVAQVFLTDPHAVSANECEDCAYLVPVHVDDPSPQRTKDLSLWGASTSGHDYAADESLPPGIFYQHFPACPLCGGWTGFDAYFRKHLRTSLEADEGWRGHKKRELEALRARPQVSG